MLEKRKEYLDQLLKNLRVLEERVSAVKNNDSLPFSFFRESFDKIQEISKTLHLLEFVQIDDMRGQMERLVYILSETESRVASETPPAEVVESVESSRSPESVESPRSSGSFRPSELSESVEPSESVELPGASELSESVEPPEFIESVEPAVFAEPVVANEPKAEETETVSRDQIGDMPRNQYARGIVLPEYRNPNSPEKSMSGGSPILGMEEGLDAEPVPVEKKAPGNGAAPFERTVPSLNDIIPAPPSFVDLKRDISLNDRFLFQRELFENNRQRMNDTIQKLGTFKDYQEAEQYMRESLSWDFENPVVADFLLAIKKGFQ